MSNVFEELPIRPKRDTFLIVSSSLLILFTAGFLWVAFSTYHNRIQKISLTESRFVKTEWHLLADLKAQTDQELLQKDQEIADLNRRYLNLVRHRGTSAEIKQVETLLHQAQAQRAAILSQRDQTVPSSTASTAGTSDWLSKLAPSVSQPLVSKLLQQRVATLDGQLKESRQQSEALTRELASTEARYNDAARQLLNAMRVKNENADNVSPSAIEELETWALVRAIISSPEIRAEYPKLLNSLDKYFREYGLQQRTKGRDEAYSSAEKLVEQFALGNASK